MRLIVSGSRLHKHGSTYLKILHDAGIERQNGLASKVRPCGRCRAGRCVVVDAETHGHTDGGALHGLVLQNYGCAMAQLTGLASIPGSATGIISSATLRSRVKLSLASAALASCSTETSPTLSSSNAGGRGGNGSVRLFGSGSVDPDARWFAMACSRSSTHSSYLACACSASLSSSTTAQSIRDQHSHSALFLVIRLGLGEELRIHLQHEPQRIVHHAMDCSAQESAHA